MASQYASRYREASRHRAGHLATVKKANFPAALPSRVALGVTKASAWPSAGGMPLSPSFLRWLCVPHAAWPRSHHSDTQGLALCMSYENRPARRQVFLGLRHLT